MPQTITATPKRSRFPSAKARGFGKKLRTFPRRKVDGDRDKQRKEEQKERRKKVQLAAKLASSSRKMMPFCEELSYNVMMGKTVASFRYNNYSFYPKVGDQFVAHTGGSGLPATFKCVRKAKTNLKAFADRYWQDVGVASREDYLSLMRRILHMEQLDFKRRGYMFIFERIA